MSGLIQAGAGFEAQLERALSRPGGLLFTGRIDVGDDSDGVVARVRGYADLGAGQVLWEQRHDEDESPIVSALVDGELRFGIGLPQTHDMDQVLGTPADTALGILFWLRAAEGHTRRGSDWELTLDPAHSAVADGLLPETGEALARRGEPLRAMVCFGHDGEFSEISIEAMMPPDAEAESATWSRWQTRIDFIRTPEIPWAQFDSAQGRDEVWRRLSAWGALPG